MNSQFSKKKWEHGHNCAHCQTPKHTSCQAAKKNDVDVVDAEKTESVVAAAATGGEEAKHPREDNEGGDKSEDEPSSKKAKVAGEEPWGGRNVDELMYLSKVMCQYWAMLLYLIA